MHLSKNKKCATNKSFITLIDSEIILYFYIDYNIDL